MDHQKRGQLLKFSKEKYDERIFTLDFKIGNINLFSRHLKFLISDQHLHYRSKGNNLEELKQFQGVKTEGIMFWFYPIEEKMPTICFRYGFICYLAERSRHYFLNFQDRFEDYQKKDISSKSMMTIRYRLRNFEKAFDANENFKEYRTVEEFEEFYRLANRIFKKTWQNRYLQAGFPAGNKGKQEMLNLAVSDLARGYILFANHKPIAFNYCVVDQPGIIVYRNIGFDPAYRQWSPGTILLYKALQKMFAEKRYKVFDFMGGEGDHKRIFSSGSIPCANIYCFKNNLGNLVVVLFHRLISIFSNALKSLIEKIGVRSGFKNIIRKIFPGSSPNRLKKVKD